MEDVYPYFSNIIRTQYLYGIPLDRFKAIKMTSSTVHRVYFKFVLAELITTRNRAHINFYGAKSNNDKSKTCVKTYHYKLIVAL